MDCKIVFERRSRDGKNDYSVCFIECAGCRVQIRDYVAVDKLLLIRDLLTK